MVSLSNFNDYIKLNMSKILESISFQDTIILAVGKYDIIIYEFLIIIYIQCVILYTSNVVNADLNSICLI